MLKVLLPIDDLSKLEPALRYVAMCERESRRPIEVHVLHVEPPLSRYVAAFLPSGVVKGYYDDQSRRVLQPVAAAFAKANIPHQTHARVDDPVKCIVCFADAAGIDRIVMVTHARASISEMLLGSVTAGVLQRSSVPVEVVPIEPGSQPRAYVGEAFAGAIILTLVYLALE